jgi:hypothetical protein
MHPLSPEIDREQVASTRHRPEFSNVIRADDTRKIEPPRGTIGYFKAIHRTKVEYGDWLASFCQDRSARVGSLGRVIRCRLRDAGSWRDLAEPSGQNHGGSDRIFCSLRGFDDDFERRALRRGSGSGYTGWQPVLRGDGSFGGDDPLILDCGGESIRPRPFRAFSKR